MSDGRPRGKGRTYPDRPTSICASGKRSFSTKRLAKQAAKKARGSSRLRVYQCRCGSFHLTSQKALAH